jgi:2-haloacid dehalogenase
VDGVTVADAFVFDTFGTLVDWRGSIVATGTELSGEHGLTVDWPTFADRWRRDGYLTPISQIVAGKEPLRPVITMLDDCLEQLVVEFGLEALSAEDRAQLLGTWDRLRPWPDVAVGLARIRQIGVISPLSNGSFATLTHIAKAGGLPWDCIISTELFRTYKPDPEAYLGACRLLELPPDRVMLVAAHSSDLLAAAACGLRTGYVPRPLEWGSDAPPPEPDGGRFDVTASDIGALADLLGAPTLPNPTD